MKLWRAIVIISTVIMFSASVFTGCGSDSNKGGGKTATVNIGVLTGLTGKAADWGKKQKIVLEMAEKEINANGGINGSPVKFIIHDTGGDNQQAVILTRKLATDEKVVAILGPYTSGECETAFPQANQLKIPMISASSNKPGVAAANRPWTFRNTMTDDKMTAAAMPVFIKNYNVKRIALVADAKDSMSKNFGTVISPKVLHNLGVTIVNEDKPITFNTGDTDYSAQVTNLKKMNADAIILGGLYNEIASLSNEMKRQGVTIPAFGNVGMYSDGLIAQAGKDVEGWVAQSNYWPANPEPRVQEFIKKFKESAKASGAGDIAPDAWTAQMYDTANITVDILRKNGVKADTPVDKVRETIRKGWSELKNYKGVIGNISIDESGEGTLEVYPLIVRNGKWVLLK